MIKVVENRKKTDDLSTQYNKPFVKVIGGIDYYIVFVLDREKADDFKVDNYLRVRINDIGRVLTGRLRTNPMKWTEICDCGADGQGFE